jgi:transcription elongation factor Elf1
LHHGASLLVESKFDRDREKVKIAGEEATMTEKFGIVQCFHCGYLQGRELVGSVFDYQGPFKSVVCYNCKKSVPLTVANVLFKFDSSAAAHDWLLAYKKQMIRGP